MNRRDSKIDFRNDYSQINEINAYTYNSYGDHVIACGTLTSSTPNLVGFFKMRNNGNYQYFYKVTTTASANCKGIDFQDNT